MWIAACGQRYRTQHRTGNLNRTKITEIAPNRFHIDGNEKRNLKINNLWNFSRWSDEWNDSSALFHSAQSPQYLRMSLIPLFVTWQRLAMAPGRVWILSHIHFTLNNWLQSTMGRWRGWTLAKNHNPIPTWHGACTLYSKSRLRTICRANGNMFLQFMMMTLCSITPNENHANLPI